MECAGGPFSGQQGSAKNSSNVDNDAKRNVL